MVAITSVEVGKSPLDEAVRLHNLMFWLYMLVLVLVALFSYLVWRSGGKVQDVIQAEANARIEEAKRDAALANQRAEEANERAATLEKEAASLLTQLVEQGSRSRLLSGERRDHLVAALKPFAGQKVEVRICATSFSPQFIDNEAMTLAMLLEHILSSSAWSLNPLVRDNCSGTGLAIDISSKAPEGTRKAAEALRAELSRLPLAVIGPTTSDRPRPPQPPTFDAASGKERPLSPLGVDTVVVTVLSHPL